MALYAFDGTWNSNRRDGGKDTNVVRFRNAYGGKVYYQEGVGTRFGVIGKLVGGLTGAGGRARVRAAIKELRKRLDKGDADIDVVGFSRGAALALDFVNAIVREFSAEGAVPSVRFLGLWDTVASFGIPGNAINLGHHLRLSDNVLKCYHAMALDERRETFPVIRQTAQVPDAAGEGRLYEVWFRGVHSDVGGGNGEMGLASIPLVWMLKRAVALGLPIDSAKVAKHEAARRPDDPIHKNVDLQKDDFRPIAWFDLVHESVTPRGVRDGVAHNDPPKRHPVAFDDGRFDYSPVV